MFSRFLTVSKNLDWWLFAAVALLVCFGLAEVYSVSYSQGVAGMAFFKKQLLAALLGLGMVWLLFFIDYYFFFSYGNYFYLLAILSLVAVLLFGATKHGTTGWFDLGGFNVQPVEMAKFFLLIFLAKYFAGVSLADRPLRHLLFSGGAVLLLGGLVLMQPDLGSAALLFGSWFLLICFIGFPKKHLLATSGLLVVTALVGWQFFLQDYQKERILSFVNPAASLSRDYNVNQAIIAVGAGGFTGRGLGFGSQSQLKFLPEAKNDFIFAVISEELGFVGVALTLGFFGLIFWRLLRNLSKINNDFGIFFLGGAAILIFSEMFINIAMNMGLAPVVGIGLPFLSYGGSALLAHLAIIGVAESIIIRAKIKNY